MKTVVRFKKLHPDAVVPTRAHPGDAGLDLHALCPFESKSMRIWQGESRYVRTGIAVQLEPGYEAQVRCRSGLALRHGIGMVNGVGTIDSGYRGEVGVLLHNGGEEAFDVRSGDRIAQIVICRLPDVEVLEVDELDPSPRGASGFGSTGR